MDMAKEEAKDTTKEDLERVIKSRVKPIIDNAMQKLIGARIVEIGTDITDRLAKNPMFDVEIDTGKSFKKAKEGFKKAFLTKLLQTHLCNVSKVADIAGIDRRSIHRMIKGFRINISRIRKNLLSKEYAQEEAVKDIVESAIDEYKQAINPERLKRIYAAVPEISKDLIKELPKMPPTLKEAEEEFERKFILKALKENKFNISKTARKIKLRYETLHRKMKALGL
jgi:DNA-binding NtrC family response regulator